MPHTQKYIGLMSGTSLDAIDAALVEFNEHGYPTLLATSETAIPTPLKTAILHLCTAKHITLTELGETDRQLGILFATAVENLLAESHTDRHTIRAIGSHGQTIWHAPNSDHPFTLQIGDANHIAAHTGIDTIADFRRKDMALGGQAAPLVPAFHQTLFAQQETTTIVLNIGGIANITVLRPHHPTIGYDTGVGNMLMDHWTRIHRHTHYDKDAAFAKQGIVNQSLLTTLLKEPYLQLPAPKSTGRERFSPNWLDHHLATLPPLPPENVQRTLLEYTAQTIADQIHSFQAEKNRLITCGGGAKNPLLIERLMALLPNWHIAPSDNYGISGDYLEAIAFAWLAYRHIHGLSGNLPEVTGASREAVLGVYYPAQ